ncbi:MAG: flippase-like domain-containing protein, partial [Myxococcales bacterium]|nr:flippase-like domain-containing protein [Myxococcales bacterium]
GNYALRFLKWEYYLAVLGVARRADGTRALPLGESALVFLSGFVLTVTPGKVGEVFKSLVLAEIRGIAMVKTAPIVVAERLTDLLGIIVLIALGGSTFRGGIAWAVAGAVVVASLLAIVLVPPFSRALLWPLSRLPGALGRIGGRVVPKVELALASLRAISRPRHLVIPSLLSICGWALEGVGVSLILRAFGNGLGTLQAMFFYATATLAGALIPVPGGLGVTEKILEESMVAIGGVPGPVATAAMILGRLATLWFAVVVGFLALGILRLRYPSLLQGKAKAVDSA